MMLDMRSDEMSDDKSKTDNRDRSQVSAEQDYEVKFLAQEAGVSVDQARKLIAQHGNDRQTLVREAARLFPERQA
jgi:hypothetical protein